MKLKFKQEAIRTEMSRTELIIQLSKLVGGALGLLLLAIIAFK